MDSACRTYPGRFTRLTAIAPQDPKTAAAEIERGRNQLGFKGVIINSHTHRIDYMHAATVRAGRYESMKPIQRRPSEYLRENVWLTTSGMAWVPAIMFCRDVLGPDRVMYAMDYPYEYTPEEVTIQDALPVDAAAKKAFFQGIAEQVFSLA